eukprot:66530-Pleurochrysis_carterae.AAC.1
MRAARCRPVCAARCRPSARAIRRNDGDCRRWRSGPTAKEVLRPALFATVLLDGAALGALSSIRLPISGYECSCLQAEIAPIPRVCESALWDMDADTQELNWLGSPYNPVAPTPVRDRGAPKGTKNRGGGQKLYTVAVKNGQAKQKHLFVCDSFLQKAADDCTVGSRHDKAQTED